MPLLDCIKKIVYSQTYPHYLLLLGKKPTGDDMYTEKLMMSFDIIPFISDKYGKPGHFSSVVKYLFTANDDFRKVSKFINVLIMMKYLVIDVAFSYLNMMLLINRLLQTRFIRRYFRQ